MDASKCMPPRKKCAATTRERILWAAHGRFLGENYDSVGLRDIARDAEVDVALVSRYFGSKEELFKEVLRGGSEAKFQLDLPPEELPAYFASLLTAQRGDDPQHQRDKLLIMLRSASSPTAAKVIQDSFHSDVLAPLAKIIGGGEDAPSKAVLVMALLIGTNFLKTVLPVAPLAEDQCRHMDGRFIQLMELIMAQVPADRSAAPAAEFSPTVEAS